MNNWQEQNGFSPSQLKEDRIYWLEHDVNSLKETSDNLSLQVFNLPIKEKIAARETELLKNLTEVLGTKNLDPGVKDAVTEVFSFLRFDIEDTLIDVVIDLEEKLADQFYDGFDTITRQITALKGEL